MDNKIKKIKKRTGEIVDFDQQKITDAVFKAITATGQGDGIKSRKVSEKVVRILNRRFKKAEIPTVEQVQDIVEEVLILEDLVDTARAYILYREQRRRIREAAAATDESSDRIDKYIQELDWQVYENANMTFSLQGLNQYAIADISKKYWLNKIYPKEIRDAAFEEDIHIHDLESISTYCCGWDLYDILKRGFGGVPGKLECRPPKHLRTALGQLVNFFYTLQGECYSEDTEVLTESGWKYFYEVDKKDKVFTLNNKNNEIELQEPDRFYRFDNKKQLYNFKTKKIDLLVTENHNMLVDQYCPKCKGGDYRRKFVKAKDFNSNEHYIPKTSSWKGRKEEWFILPGINIMQYRHFINKPKLAFLKKTEEELVLSKPSWKYEVVEIGEKKILMNDWLKFFGFYMAEGNSYMRKRRHKNGTPYNEYLVRIFQNEGDIAKKFEKVLKTLPFHYRRKVEGGNKVVFEIENKQLYLYLAQFGKRETKFIPKEIKGLSKDQLNILFDWLMKGDGYIGNGNIEYYTKSKRLADDVQEIILKLGWNANIYEKRKAEFKWYCVGVSRTKRLRFKKESVRKIEYSGKVYCLEVPNHTLYIRRKGKACWCGNSAGAQAVSNFDTLIAPFIRYDGLSYPQVKQAMQEFLYNCMVPTRVGFQTPFLNISLDINPPSFLAKQPVIIGGKPQKENYGDFQEEMNMLLKAFYEGIMEGDAKGRPFTFPIPTVSIGKDFDWENPALDGLWEATAKYGINYFSNFIHSDMKPEDFRSMCCRLRLDNKELYMRGGGLFGSQPLTGSVGVVTINIPRIGYLSKTKKDFFNRLNNMMDLAKESLEIKRKALDNLAEKGLYPYSKHYLDSVKKIRGSYFGNHFSTIGLIGMNEALLNFIGEDVGSKRGRKFAAEILDFMRERLVKYQKETGHLYNLEATPGEGTSYRQAKADKEKYQDIITAGTKEAPYYTNSSQLPVNYTDDVFDALKLQNDLQCKYTGGCVEKGNKVLTNKGLLPIENIVNNFKKLKSIKALSYNSEKRISEWDDVVEAVKIDVKKHDKIRVKGERGLDIVTSDWHPFFVLKKFRPNPSCPICEEKVGNIKGFATHIRWNVDCGEKYKDYPKYKVIEKRADELESGDYILQNSYNVYPDTDSEINEELMWLAGFFIGDGCISKYKDNRGGNKLEKHKARFFSEHQRALEKVADILNRYFNTEVRIIKNDKRSKVLREISTSKKSALDFLFNIGFKPGKKVYDISIPEKIKNNLTKNNFFSFLSGLMDSDGHIDKKQGDFEYYTVSPALADDILEICSKAGIMISKSEKKTRRKNEVNIWRLRIPNYELTRIKSLLSDVVNHSRIKKVLSNRLKRYLPVVRVIKTSKVRVKDNQFYDLMTKKNHNYLAGNNSLVFIHNTVLHLFLGERVQDPNSAKMLVKKVFEKFSLPYITLTPTFSICPSHGYLSGEHFECPKCTIKQPCEVYSRIVGYIRPVRQWHTGKQQEFKERKEFKIKKATA